MCLTNKDSTPWALCAAAVRNPTFYICDFFPAPFFFVCAFDCDRVKDGGIAPPEGGD